VLKIYTRTGDDGTTGLLYGGRVPKDSLIMQINGAVDEAQAVMGTARAESQPGSELDQLLTRLERDLYVLMAEVATDPSKRSKLKAGATLVTAEMVTVLEAHIDDLIDRFEMPTEFVVPGANRASAALDVARTVVRRAERLLVSAPIEGSLVGQYLNRLSDLLWAMARWAEGEEHLLARGAPRRSRARSDGRKKATGSARPNDGANDGGRGPATSGEESGARPQ
jgi:cob(I)alamin adenosyltransferase